MVEPIKLVYKPGINRDVTEYSAMGSYVDGNLIRFVKGHPQSMGGWRRLTTDKAHGTPRGLFPFVMLDGTQLYTMGTDTKYYTINGTELIDITPIRATVVLNAPFDVANGSDSVLVHHTAHGGLVGDFVTFSGATAFAGFTADEINQEFAIDTVVDPNSYRITLPHVSTSAVSGGGGATVSAAYQLEIGINSTVSGLGWGTGPYSEGGFGEPSEGVETKRLRLWTQDKFGEDVVVSLRDGAIYYYDVSLGLNQRMVKLDSMPGANKVPTIARQVLLSDKDRHLIALGCNGYTDSVLDPLLVRWCDREQAVEWGISTTTTAGSLRLDAGSEIVTGIKLADAVMVFTDVSLHTLRYVGSPYVFGQVKAADNVHIMGPNAGISVATDLYFMGISKFHMFNGGVVDLNCDIEDYIFGILNFEERGKVWAGYNSTFGEVFWLLPVNGSTEVNFYVTYTPATGVWAYGAFGDIGRTSWLDVHFEQYPLATATDGYVYMHDIGDVDGAYSPPRMLDSWVEAAPIEIGAGDDYMHCSRIIPDIDFTGSSGEMPAVEITLQMVDAPGTAPRDTERSLAAKRIPRDVTFPVGKHTAKKDVKIRGRAMKYKIQATAVGTKWKQGTHRLYATPDGKQ